MLRRTLVGLLVVAALAGAAAAGYALGVKTAEEESASTTATTATAPGFYLDDEFTYLGALKSWPERPKSATKNPFRGFDDAQLVELGRTVCIRAADPGMDFDGMLDLLELNPHQTFVVITEAIDKLCPSRGEHLDELTS